MVTGTGISLWRYLAQIQVDSQTHAERRMICLFIIMPASKTLTTCNKFGCHM